MTSYGLDFISDENLYTHIKNTVDKYRATISLETFQKNIIDPIKLTFDAKIYQQTWEEIIESEIVRQLDKSNNNHIGYFHQNIFNYIDGWSVPKKGFDIINAEHKIYVEMKNKHNTMNSSSSQKTYMRMQNKLLDDPDATCMLVEVIARKSQNIAWTISLDGQTTTRQNIRRVSIDKFYELATQNSKAFVQLCEVLPRAIDEVLADSQLDVVVHNTVMQEFLDLYEDGDVLKSIFKTSFSTYQGINDFRWR